MKSGRSYSMAVRGAKAAETRERILKATRELFATQSVEFTLEKVAAMAGTSIQTVFRAYGSKEALIEEAIGSMRRKKLDPPKPAQSATESVRELYADYEEIGDRVIRMLAEELRIPAFAAAARVGRAEHRAWVDAAFDAELAAHPLSSREEVRLALLAATDVYVWKVLRRDFGLERPVAESIVLRLIQSALADEKGK